MSRLRRGFALVAGTAALLAIGDDASAKGGPPRPRRAGGRDEPIGAPIRDVATRLSVPLDDDRSFVIGLPPRFWVQCPRVLPTRTSLDGDGVIAQYLNLRGGTVSMLYVGTVPVSASTRETTGTKMPSAVSDFFASLAPKYLAVDWELFSGPVTATPVTFSLDGKRTPAWRTKRYNLRPALAYGGPESVFVGECLVLLPPDTDRLVYVALDAKGGGTTLDKVIEDLSVKRTRDVNPEARRAQLVDIAEAVDKSRFPVRQIAFDLPPGFVVTPAVLALKGEWVYVEERLDANGRPDAVLRIRQRHADETRTLAQDLEEERAIWSEKERGPAEEVKLAAAGHVAWVFSHPSPRDSATARAHTAVLRLDEQTVMFSWITLGDAAQAERDRAAFVGLVGSIDLTIRW